MATNLWSWRSHSSLISLRAEKTWPERDLLSLANKRFETKVDRPIGRQLLVQLWIGLTRLKELVISIRFKRTVEWACQLLKVNQSCALPWVCSIRPWASLLFREEDLMTMVKELQARNKVAQVIDRRCTVTWIGIAATELSTSPKRSSIRLTTIQFNPQFATQQLRIANTKTWAWKRSRRNLRASKLRDHQSTFLISLLRIFTIKTRTSSYLRWNRLVPLIQFTITIVWPSPKTWQLISWLGQSSRPILARKTKSKYRRAWSSAPSHLSKIRMQSWWFLKVWLPNRANRFSPCRSWLAIKRPITWVFLQEQLVRVRKTGRVFSIRPLFNLVGLRYTLEENHLSKLETCTKSNSEEVLAPRSHLPTQGRVRILPTRCRRKDLLVATIARVTASQYQAFTRLPDKWTKTSSRLFRFTKTWTSRVYSHSTLTALQRRRRARANARWVRGTPSRLLQLSNLGSLCHRRTMEMLIRRLLKNLSRLLNCHQLSCSPHKRR